MDKNLEISTSSMQDKPIRWSLAHKLMDNPIIAKELKSRMRGSQGFIILTAYLTLISLVIASAYFYSVNDGNILRSDTNALQEMGKQIFSTVFILELLMIVIIGPALTSGAISSERERGTFDLLRTTLLSPRALVLGKLGSTVMYLLLLIFAALPLQSLAFFLGGVGMTEMIISIVMLAASTFLFCMLGLYFSSIAKRTIIATTLSYATLLFPAIVLTILYYMLENGDINLSTPSIEAQRIFILFAWTSLSTNPITAAAITQIILTEEQNYFVFYPPDFSLALFSPWILYVTFAAAMTFFMVWLIVFYLNRYER
jgi:ABC-type transport system involved in multi-copper enzyme maturation permease subunit